MSKGLFWTASPQQQSVGSQGHVVPPRSPGTAEPPAGASLPTYRDSILVTKSWNGLSTLIKKAPGDPRPSATRAGFPRGEALPQPCQLPGLRP